MKMRIVLDIEASTTILDTIQRTGFTVAKAGSGMQVLVPNAPVITNRKVKIEYIKNPQDLKPKNESTNEDEHCCSHPEKC